MIKSFTLSCEMHFLEALYEQLSSGELLYPALIKACQRLPQKQKNSMVFLQHLLHHGQQCGMSRLEILQTISAHAKSHRMRELFHTFSEHEKLGSAKDDTIAQMITTRMWEIYTEAEKRIESAPVKLMAPLFACIFVGSSMFILAAVISVVLG